MSSSDDRFVDLYENFYSPVYAYCRRRTEPDVAEDVTAETFLIAWRKIDLVPRGSEILPWLYGVAYRVIGNQWRSTRRGRKLHEKLSAIGYETPAAPETVIVTNQESRQVVAALDSLKPIDREILMLAAWEELPQADIAVTLQISGEAVRQRLHQAKKNLTRAHDRLSRPSLASRITRGGGS